MFSRLGLVPIIAAASLAVAGCDGQPAEAPANDTVPVATNDAASTSPATQGAPTGGKCGGFPAIQCAASTDFCKIPEGQCGVADASGICTTRPEICTKERVPVCGCDGKTYGNACEADMAGVNVQAAGECPKPNG